MEGTAGSRSLRVSQLVRGTQTCLQLTTADVKFIQWRDALLVVRQKRCPVWVGLSVMCSTSGKQAGRQAGLRFHHHR